MTLFSVKNYADEFLGALDKNFKKKALSDFEDESIGATADDIIESTKDFILKELSRQFKGYDLEGFVADLLRAMGYRCKGNNNSVIERCNERGRLWSFHNTFKLHKECSEVP